MTGSATLTGRFSAAVGTACEASKTKPPYVLTDVIVDRLWVPFSPCGHRAPVFPSIASGYASPVWPPIPALPVTLRIASPCQLPASRPAPPVHPRKGAVRHKNSSRDTEIDDGRLSDICGSCFLCLTLVNIVSTVSYWCTNVCHIYYNTVCVAGIMQRDIPF